MRVLAISGSLRHGSYNSTLLAAAAAEAPAGVEVVRWRGLEQLPPYNPDRDRPPAPAAVAALRQAIAASDAVLIATPEYNASIPGALKNALDWASRPFPDHVLRRKPVAVVGASTSLFGAVWAQAELRKVLQTIGAAVLDAELPVPAAHEAFTGDGRLRDPALATALRTIIEELRRRPATRAA